MFFTQKKHSQIPKYESQNLLSSDFAFSISPYNSNPCDPPHPSIFSELKTDQEKKDAQLNLKHPSHSREHNSKDSDEEITLLDFSLHEIKEEKKKTSVNSTTKTKSLLRNSS